MALDCVLVTASCWGPAPPHWCQGYQSVSGAALVASWAAGATARLRWVAPLWGMGRRKGLGLPQALQLGLGSCSLAP